MLTIGEIAQALDAAPPLGADWTLAETVIDSRQARPGDLFVALPGETHDGHEFVAAAFQRGARAALVTPAIRQQALDADEWEPASGEAQPPMGERALCIIVPDVLAALQRIAAWRRRQRPACQVIGVTGSVGKTTTKEAVAAVVAQRYETLRSPGNYNNEIGLPLTLLQLEPRHQRAVLEMSMYALGEIALLAELAAPRIGVVTNVEPIHLERLGALEAIAQAKAELPRALPPEGAAVLNGDDPRVRAMAALTPARRVLTFGLASDNELWADGIVSRGLQGTALTLHHQGRAVALETPMLGAHSAWAALAAAGVGLVEGLSWDEIAAGLGQPNPPLRMVIRRGLRGAMILDDTYNAGPSSTVAALDFLATLPGRPVAVLGDMLELGSYEREGHRQVGRKAGQVASELVTMGTRARAIAEAAREAGLAGSAIHQAASHAEAVAILRERLQAGDVVLVKGSRSMAMDKIVAAIGEETA